MSVDAYYYARDHENGAGAWCVRGPDGFEMKVPSIDKCQAYVIGKVLSGRYGDAIEMLRTLQELEKAL